MKIQDRLTYQFIGITSIILIIFSFVVLFFSQRLIERDFYRNLENRAEITAIIYLEADEINASTLNKYRKMYMQTLSEEFTKIYNLNREQVFFETEDHFLLSGEHFNEIVKNGSLHTRIGERQLAGIFYHDNQGDFVIIASAIDDAGIKKMQNLQIIVIITLMILLGFSYFAGRIFARRSLMPLKQVVNQIGHINPDKLFLRVDEGNGKDEISELALSFNKMLDRLQHSFDIQKTFVANASHELRTPLTGISVELELALKKKQTATEYENTLISVQEEIEKLSNITENILNFAKASFDISNIPFKITRIDELLHEATSLVNKKFKGRKINIHFNDLKDERYLQVMANEQLLLICLNNIIENALKFSGSEDKVNIEIVPVYEQLAVDIIIKDKGIGIPEEDKKNIFNTFYRASNARNFAGFGVGLALSKKIIEIHQGSISINSQTNEGTEVHLRLPIG
jgi:two-component system, OmpR family, sensor histidine kinase ArlS